MLVKQIMTQHPVTVGLDEDLEALRALFKKTGFHHVLVLDDKGRLCGVVSDRDLLRSISPFVGTAAARTQDLQTLNRKVHQIMSRAPVVARAEQELWMAAYSLLEHKISCLPVLSVNDELLGILTWRDILRALVEGEDRKIQ